MDIVRATVSRNFAKHFNGQKNIFTPHVLAYGAGKNHLQWELSSGEIMGDPVFGVTVIRAESGRIESQYDLSKAFLTELEATKYIETL